MIAHSEKQLQERLRTGLVYIQLFRGKCGRRQARLFEEKLVQCCGNKGSKKAKAQRLRQCVFAWNHWMCRVYKGPDALREECFTLGMALADVIAHGMDKEA